MVLHGLGQGRRRRRDDLGARSRTAGYSVLAYDARGHGDSGGCDHARRPARGRRPARAPQRLRGACGGQRHEDRRLGHLLRRRPDLECACGRGAVRGGRGRRDVDVALPVAVVAGPGALLDRRRLLVAGSPPARRSSPVSATTPFRARNLGNCARDRRGGAALPRPGGLASITTPVYLFQGRVDFVFDITQAPRRRSPRSAARRSSTSARSGTRPLPSPARTGAVRARAGHRVVRPASQGDANGVDGSKV